MALDIFFSEDIRNALLAADEASSSAAAVITAVQGADAPDSVIATLRAYRKGYRAALTTVALAFGLSPSVVGAGQAQREREALPVETRGVVVE